MKRTLWQITLASLLTLGAYIALSVLWRALLSGIQQPTLQLLLVCFMTTAAFGWFLLYTAKIRGSVGEEEVLDDYKEGAYGSLKDELRRVLRRERILLLCIAGIILLCFALNTFDQLPEQVTDSTKREALGAKDPICASRVYLLDFAGLCKHLKENFQ